MVKIQNDSCQWSFKVQFADFNKMSQYWIVIVKRKVPKDKGRKQRRWEIKERKDV